MDTTPSSELPPYASHLGGDLKKRSVQSGSIVLSSQAVLFIMNTAFVVIMARLLAPEDYGIIAMVTAVTGFVSLFNELGLSSATIQKSEISHKQLSALFWINILVGVLLMIIICILSPAIAWFYSKPQLTAVTLIVSIAFPLTSLGTQHSALLNRQMQFGRLAAVNIASRFASIFAGLLLALHGGRYWALVVSTLTMAFCRTLGVWIAGIDFRPSWTFRNSGIRELVYFGFNITAFDLVNYFHRNFDNLLIGRVLGAQQLGLYNRAYSLLLLPIRNLRAPLNEVAFPALSSLQNDSQRFRSYFKKYCFLLSFLSMPVVAFLCITSEEVIHLLLGDQWLDAAGIFRILAIVAFIQPVVSLRGLVLISYGEAKRYFRLGLINSIAAVASFSIGISWGIKGVAFAYCIMTYAILHPSLMYAFKNTPIKVLDFYRSIIHPIVASVVMCFLGLLVMTFLESHPDYITLLLTAPFCIFAYVIAFAALPGGLNELKTIWAYRSVFGARFIAEA